MLEDKRTKIIATIGPASDSIDLIEKLVNAGVNIFRFNMKHNTLAWHEERINRVGKVSAKLGKPVGIYIDLQGPEIRIEVQETLDGIEGDEFKFTSDRALFEKEKKCIFVGQKQVTAALEKGDEFTIDDGVNEFVVVSKARNYLVVKATSDVVVENRKGMNLKYKDVALPSLTLNDLEKLQIAKRTKADYVGLSFTRSKEDIADLRRELKALGIAPKVLAKVESHRGVENIDEIIDAADCVMVARGDLGVEISFEKVTYYQKHIVEKCRHKHKAVVVATQMLESMITNPLPTRAEAADVANAVFDGADAVMLSGETATGKYPLKTVEVMRRILRFNEENARMQEFKFVPKDQTQVIVSAAVNMINNHASVRFNKVLLFTETGYTARVISSFRCHTPIIAVSNNKETIEALTISYGVFPYYSKFPSGDFILPEDIVTALKEKGLLKTGERVLLVHGRRWMEPGNTNALVMITI